MLAETSVSPRADCPLLCDFNPMRFYWQTWERNFQALDIMEIGLINSQICKALR